MTRRQETFLTIILILVCQVSGLSQQVADSSYDPPIPHPQYPRGAGTAVFIDEGHYNFHTKDGRYLPFAKVLEKDGYVVKAFSDEFTMKNLRGVKILVIANALNEVNSARWYLPTPSAFSGHEIEVLKSWVNSGGSLFLIADHMPFGGAAADLAASFGFSFSNGFAVDTLTAGPSYFTLKEGTLHMNPITSGRDTSESVHSIVTFTGQAFPIPKGAVPILTFGSNWMNYETDTAWVFNEHTRKIPIAGWSQGAFKEEGKGRVVVFGEAAMFSAQLAGPNRRMVGMNAAYAPENFKLLLNIIHWLDGR